MKKDSPLSCLEAYLGRVVTSARIGNDCLVLSFEGGSKIVISDDGQICCENRYMSTDDDVQSLVGHKLVRIEVKDTSDVAFVENEGDREHEVCFLEIGTDDGFITIVNHNEHNGYYGGFCLSVQESTQPIPASA